MSQLLFALVLMCVVNSALSKADNDTRCDNAGFSSSYYLLDDSDIGAVSRYFQQMEDAYFKDLQDFTGSIGHQQRVETYFDYLDLRILKNNQELLIAVNENLPGYRVEREWVTHRDNSKSPASIRQYEVKRYNKKRSSLDKHPLFGRIKRKERPQLTNELNRLEEGSPDNLVKTLQIEHDEIVYLITHYGYPYAAVTLSKFYIASYGLPNTSTLLKIEKYDDAEKNLNTKERSNLNRVLCQVNQGVRHQFPNLQPVAWFGYADYQQIASKLMPTRDVFVRHPVVYTLGQIIVLSFMGFLIIYLLIGRYEKRENYRKIMLNNDQERDEK